MGAFHGKATDRRGFLRKAGGSLAFSFGLAGSGGRKRRADPRAGGPNIGVWYLMTGEYMARRRDAFARISRWARAINLSWVPDEGACELAREARTYFPLVFMSHDPPEFRHRPACGGGLIRLFEDPFTNASRRAHRGYPLGNPETIARITSMLHRRGEKISMHFDAQYHPACPWGLSGPIIEAYKDRGWKNYEYDYAKSVLERVPDIDWAGIYFYLDTSAPDRMTFARFLIDEYHGLIKLRHGTKFWIKFFRGDPSVQPLDTYRQLTLEAWRRADLIFWQFTGNGLDSHPRIAAYVKGLRRQERERVR